MDNTEIDALIDGYILDMQALQVQSMVTVSKEADGRYHIVAVSTAAVKDREDDVFTVEAIDADILRAEKTGVYPEFRVFHSASTGFGMVTKMRRIGIFAVDEGYSYDDPFSISVCEKMLVDNDGTWRASRGFRAKSLDLECSGCGSRLDITLKHMVAGFRCSVCDTVHLSIQGKSAHYKEVETFDITVTDVPAVTYTSFQAFSTKSVMKERIMKMKDKLRNRLIAAGIPEQQVLERLETVSETALKEFNIDDIPDAQLLKEYGDADNSGADDVVVLDQSALDEIHAVVKEAVIDVFGDIEFEFDDDIVTKEADPRVDELVVAVEKLTVLLKSMAESDETRYKERVTKAPRKSRKRVARMSKKVMDEDEEEEDEEETAAITKETANWFNPAMRPSAPGQTFQDGDGNTYKSMSEMLEAA